MVGYEMGRHVNQPQRDAILKRCYNLFQLDGCDSLTTRQIADECGMSRALLYMYYHKKGDICVEIFNRMQDDLHSFLDARIDLRVPEKGYGAYYFPMLMGTLDRRNLLSVFLNIQRDSELLHKVTYCMYELDNREFAAENLDEFGVGVFIMMGAFSQLLQCREKGILRQPLSDMVYTVLEVYYRYMGLKEKEIKAIFQRSRQFVSDGLIGEFIAFHEREYRYDEPDEDRPGDGS